MKVTRITPGRPSRTTGDTRTTGWEPLIYSLHSKQTQTDEMRLLSMLQDCKTDVKTVTVSCLRPALYMQRFGRDFSTDFM